MQTDRMTRMERLFQVNTRAVDVPGQEAEEQELYVEGYAVRFDSPTVLFEYGGTEYKEQIDRHAFDGALMEDVIFNYNHGGKVLARTRNDTLWLTVDDTGADMRCQLARGDQAWLSLSSGAPRITLELMLSLSQSLGTLLADFEREEHRSIEMGDSPLQLTYALTREEWQEKWPDVLALIADVFPAYDLSGFDITSDKATFKRYFARDGQEIGAYFYAGSARVAPEDIREIRLEWGCRADKALYLAFRSPSQGKGETRNFRIAFSARIAKQTVWSCEVRRVAGDYERIFAADGRYTSSFLDGKSTASYQRKQGKRSLKYTLTLQPNGEQAAAYALNRGGKLLLSGTVQWTAAALPAELPVQTDTAALARLFMQTLMAEDPANAQALLQALCWTDYLNGDITQLRVSPEPTRAADKEDP